MTNSTKKTAENIDYFLDSIYENTHKLTKWEHDFIDSVTAQWGEKNWISDKQFEILERIYAEKT